MTTTSTAKAPIAPGNRKPFSVPGTFGRTVVTLANNSVGTREHWNVEVTVGGAWVDATSRPFATEDEARTYARRMVREYHAAAVESRREELRRYLAEQDARRQRGMHDRAGVAAAEVELAGLEDDELAALRLRLRSDAALIAHLALSA